MSELARIVEALLFLVARRRQRRRPRRGRRAATPTRSPRRSPSSTAQYAPGERGLQLKRVAGGIALATDPVAEDAARRLLAKPRTPPLTPAQAETLAIVAYLQPVSRPGDHAHPRRRRRVGERDARGARLHRGGRPLAVRRRPVPHDRSVPQALRAGLAQGAAERRRVGPVARGGGRPARPPAARRRAARGRRRGGLSALVAGRSALRARGGELPAGGRDVAPAREAHGRAQPVLLEHRAERVDRVRARAVVGAGRVVRDEVDLEDLRVQQPRRARRPARSGR